MPIDLADLAIKSSVKKFAYYLAFDRSLERCPSFKLGGSGVVIMVTPPEQPANAYVSSAHALLYDSLGSQSPDAVGIGCANADDKPGRIRQEFLENCNGRERAILISETGDLPAEVVVASDFTIQLEDLTAEDIKAACQKVLMINLTKSQARKLLDYPRELMFAAMKRGRTFSNIIARLETATSIPIDRKTPLAETVRPLEELHGYGPAKEWGLQLAKDLKDWQRGDLGWSDIDRGLLLSGPPGVGKTIYARALAKTCGVNFVATSVVQWQAKGHLGDLLKAMRAEFKAAVDRAPSILFIDELDSIGDRQTFNGEHTSYSIQVVNGLLECLDGAGHRDGVVVIGATNFPDNIDAAIRRPGRLDRHVAIGLPNNRDRLAIISQLLGSAELPDLESLGPSTEGMTGADLARVVRDAKKQARRGSRPLRMADLASQLPTPIRITGAYRRRIAVHEAGHTLVGRELVTGLFIGVTIVSQLIARPGYQTAGGARFDVPLLSIRNEQYFRDQICLLLGGIAAERLLFGGHSDGAGNGPTSDLAVATDLALQMETRTGLGSRLQNFGRGTSWEDFSPHSVPWLMEKIESILKTELARAIDILESKRELLIAVTNELDEKGVVSSDRVNTLQKESEAKGSPGGKRISHRDADVPPSEDGREGANTDLRR
ncbi:AAA family ATPase (plasmid) [Rhizobium leguminosarum]|uniref:AAA family ATPase n=1 Tax=Rhizobium leguminosarum TaxID=384 RepID=UPI00103247A3|nr:AAA family ATPase [Rhizobium leguminosarum]TAY27680.1 AAA family ATPase [Rhizobium leguminosarum]